MPVHDCESLQPVAWGMINYDKEMRVVGGSKPEDALPQALQEAADDAETAGQAAAKNDTCASPCSCRVFVLPQFWNTSQKWLTKKKCRVTITGMWTAYVVCFDPAKHPKKPKGDGPKDGDGEPKEKSGGKSDDKEGKPKGKPKSEKKVRKG